MSKYLLKLQVEETLRELFLFKKTTVLNDIFAGSVLHQRPVRQKGKIGASGEDDKIKFRAYVENRLANPSDASISTVSQECLGPIISKQRVDSQVFTSVKSHANELAALKAKVKDGEIKKAGAKGQRGFPWCGEPAQIRDGGTAPQLSPNFLDRWWRPCLHPEVYAEDGIGKRN
ncbi:hypothetical protein BC829DRAFT_416705 [Chytridium lagenaria]|nr:hypothetical protein BC829DRAFT_416705 [Chytridium lagenaria]